MLCMLTEHVRSLAVTMTARLVHSQAQSNVGEDFKARTLLFVDDSWNCLATQVSPGREASVRWVKKEMSQGSLTKKTVLLFHVLV